MLGDVSVFSLGGIGVFFYWLGYLWEVYWVVKMVVK